MSVLRHSSARPSWSRRSGAGYVSCGTTRLSKFGGFRFRYGGRDCLCQFDEYPELDIDDWVGSEESSACSIIRGATHDVFWQLLEGCRVGLPAVD